jgi:histidinol-phosphate aminotransferase
MRPWISPWVRTTTGRMFPLDRRPKPRPELRAVRRTSRTEYAGNTRWRLDKNENLAPSPGLWREVARRLSPEAVSRYPDYNPFLGRLARRGRCRPEELLLTAGSDGAIKLAFEAYVRPGDDCVVPWPSFAMFEVYAKIFGGAVRRVPFPSDLSAPVDAVAAAIGPRTRLVVLANPNNPTGTRWDKEALRTVVRRAARFGALVLLDEAYYYFTRETFWEEVRRFSNVLLTRTFSKAAGGAGLRLGFAFSRAPVIETLRKCQSIFEVNAAALAFGEIVLRREKDLWAYAARVEEGRAFLTRRLEVLGYRARPGEGNFLLADLGRDAAAVARRLERAGVRVGHGFRHPSLRSCLKITLGPEDVMRSFWAKFRRVAGRS